MKKQAKSNHQKQLVFVTIAFFAFLFAAQIEIAAQDKMKAGDRVGSPTSGEALEKGVIKEIGSGTYEGCYLVLYDYQKNTGSKGNWVCTYGQMGSLFVLDSGDKRVRDVNAPAAEKPETPGAAASVGNTTPPQGNSQNKPNYDVPIQCGGELLLEPKTKGRKASVALFRDVIKASWDQAADERTKEGRRVATIDSLTMGAPYAWRPGIDFQSLGTKPKTVYPVKVKYSYCKDYRLEWRVHETKAEEIRSCYVEDKFGEWTCDIQKSVDFKRTYIDKPEKKKITGE